MPVHSGPSRSGPVNYSGNNNRFGSGATTQSPGRMPPATPGRIAPGSGVAGRVFNHGGPGLVHDGWRVGYHSYWGGWRDGFFWYPWYVFDPFLAPVFCSPWYYYPCLPPYIAAPRCVIVDTFPSTGWTGDEYNWQPPQDQTDNHQETSLDYSVDDIVSAFQDDDTKAMDRLAPHSGNVNIYTDGKYSYSLAANDFYDTFKDGIESTKTDHYEILDVKQNADGAARVTAKHIYTDPWGKRAYVYHSFFLVKEGDNYVIREFGTSNYKAD